jgi:hypothetical protein
VRTLKISKNCMLDYLLDLLTFRVIFL